MRTRQQLRDAMRAGEVHEGAVYTELTQAIFRGLQHQLQSLYDEAIQATSNLTAITPNALQAAPRLIKILRYCTAPAISQMRLGQLLGIRSTDLFENETRSIGEAEARTLATWFKDNLDADRFPWACATTAWDEGERRIAEQYAKLWTVSLVSNQNALTAYRNQRKQRQEGAILNVLGQIGLTLQRRLQPAPQGQRRPSSGGIHFTTDLLPRSYVREQKVAARSQKRQKSDVTVRPTDAEQLFCIEAKAVGIRIDSAKRLKELNEKYTDWSACGLPITTVGVVSGFFNENELIATIKLRGIPIFFEHDLAPLGAFLQSQDYFGGPWRPADLFADVSETEVEAGMERIETAPIDTDDQPAGDAEDTVGESLGRDRSSDREA
jgi:hypothetical protein